ncbi:MAG: hypothetical protein NW226_02310 [Microscillaceae bacterium]|nr:hypothetical protein [Microscillaceae bacterium]
MKKLFYTSLVLLSITWSHAQVKEIPSGNYTNIQASYEYQLLKKVEKKKITFDEYYLKMTIQINNPLPLYATQNTLVDFKVLNTEKTFYDCSSAADYGGKSTGLTTRDGKILYELSNGTFSTTCNFRVPVGVTPIIEASMVDGFRTLDNFDVIITNAALVGTWNLIGTENNISIKAIEQDIEITGLNYKKYIWKKIDSKKYVRELTGVNGELYSSTLQIIDPNTIAYSNSEGVHCLWKRK